MPTDTHPNAAVRPFPAWLRWVLGGPVALVIAVVAMAASTLLLPAGAAGVNHVAFALILFPAFWGVTFFYVMLEERPGRAMALCLAAFAFCATAVYAGVG